MSKRVGFAADYETRVVTVRDGVSAESREVYRLYRDARGRTRMEGTVGALRFAFLTDVQQRRAVVIDLTTGKPVEPSHSVQAPVACSIDHRDRSTTRVEDLGEALIEGLTARGMRTTIGSATFEVWTAREVDQPPVLVESKDPSREETQRLLNVRIGDPDPVLFAPLDDHESLTSRASGRCARP